MRTRRSSVPALLLAMLAAFALVVGACSSDDSDDKASDSTDQSDSAKDSTTTADDSGDSTDDTTTDDTTDTPEESSGDFVADVSEATTALETAQDACGVYDAVAIVGATSSNPTTTDEVKVAVDFYVAMLEKMAATSSDPEAAATLSEGAVNFRDYAESVNYEPEKMNLNGAGPAVKDMDKLDAAMNSYADAEFVECQDLSGAVPDTTPEG